jgi:putative phosphoribosyl transferase
VKGYEDRGHAGDVLARELDAYRDRPDVTVLGLVRGGVPVAARVAAALRVPLDVLVVRKLGVPGLPELAFGALGPGGVRVLNPEVARRLDTDEINAVVAAESAELERRERRYRAGRPPLALGGRTAILVDDGLATGASAAAAVAVARGLGATRVVLAVPVAPPDAVARLARLADEVRCPLTPPRFGAVGRYYLDFTQVTDDEVIALSAPGGAGHDVPML